MGGADRLREEARRACLYLAVVYAIGSSVAVALARWHGVPFGAWPELCTFAAASIGFLLAASPPRWASLILLSVLSLFALGASSLSAETMATSGHAFSPFNSTKIIALTVAIFCPSVPLGLLLIGATIAQPIVL